MFVAFFSEIIGTFMERKIGNAKRFNGDAINGTLSGYRYIACVLTFGFYAVSERSESVTEECETTNPLFPLGGAGDLFPVRVENYDQAVGR